MSGWLCENMGVPRTCETFGMHDRHALGGNEAGLVHVSSSYTLRFPFVLYTYEILSLGSISCLKVLEEINSKIIVILTSTALFMRNEKMQKESALLIHLQLKEEQTHVRNSSSIMCF